MGLVFSWLWGQKEAPPLLDVATEAQVIPPAEAPVVAPAETEIPTVDTTVIETETEQTSEVCEPETEVEAEAVAEEETVTEVEVVIPEDVVVPESEIEITEEPAAEVVEEISSEQVEAEQVEAEQVEAEQVEAEQVEAEQVEAEKVEAEQAEAEQVVVEPVADEMVTETVAESVVEVISEVPEPEQVTEAAVSPAAPAEEEEDEGEVEVLAEKDAPEVPAEPVTVTEDVPVQSVEIPVVPDTIPETVVEEAAPIVNETTEVVADMLVDDFVVTESVSAVEVAIAESAAAVEQDVVATIDTPIDVPQTESMDVTPAEPEPAVVVPAEEMIIDAATEQKCLDMLSEEPKSEMCDMPCQMQLAVESVQLSSVEMPVETALNGHIVPEVSIEG
ncbi:probable serine/threonine-protein kinase kinX isoform X2 [Amphiprion ocellaris]|uniref:probable serine/threonine-protein kinase kinX isoform X2 n=1 Tax=Amphiprion ocellaris TaxID=80972 RepID=UPI0016498A32|nr:probable serine/threonine-protein kinase kinX isoform X2 [Amphiprion ocellaris]